MIRVLHTTRAGGVAAAIFVLAALFPNSAALAQQAAGAPRDEPAPSAPNLYDPNLFKFSPAAPGDNLGKLDLGKFGKDAPELSPPKQPDIGKYFLQFDSSRVVIDYLPRVVINRSETLGLSLGLTPEQSSLLPTPKHSPIIQNYFGLTLTAPLN